MGTRIQAERRTRLTRRGSQAVSNTSSVAIISMMKKMIRKIAILVASAFALGQVDVARAADANPPERMTYQGYLVDVNGDADAVGSGWATEKL